MAWLACSAAAAADTKRVMLLHSFGRDFKPWSEYAKSIRAELVRQSPWPLDITDHSLVTARSSDDDPETAFAEYLHALFAKHPLDLIVSIGAPAAAFVQRHRQRIFARTPMVLTAIDQRRVQYSVLTPDDAVVAVKIDYRAAIENILRVLPDTKNLMMVVGASPIERFWKEAITQEHEPLANRLGASWTDHLSFEEILKQAAALPPHSAIFWELMIVDAAGVVHEGVAPLTRLHAVANAPIFSYDESFFGQIVGGPLLLVADTSRRTAAVAVRILGGEKAGDIKVSPVPFGTPMFDWREMQRWGITESSLPPGSEIHFRDPTMWERYRLQLLAIVAVLLIQSALIAWLAYEHRRRQIAEADSLQRLNELARINRVATAGELSASIAHEIRQPLAAIASSGGAGLNWLKNKVPNLEEVRSALQTIVNQSHRADEVIKSVRAMFDRESVVRTDVNLNEVIDQVLALTSRVINSNRIALVVKLADYPSPRVIADPVQLQQVVLNLIMNAVEAMTSSDHWFRSLHIETGTEQPGIVWLTVIDSGPGLDASVAENLFKPFVTTKTKGMGMGLSISKSIIEQHEGRLTATSVEPRGLMFRITLPRAPAT